MTAGARNRSDCSGGSSVARRRARAETRATVTWGKNARFSGVYQPPSARAVQTADWIRASALEESSSLTPSTRGRRGGSHSPDSRPSSGRDTRSSAVSQAAAIPPTSPAGRLPMKHSVACSASWATGRSSGICLTAPARHASKASRMSGGRSSATNRRSRPGSPLADTAATQAGPRPGRLPRSAHREVPFSTLRAAAASAGAARPSWSARGCRHVPPVGAC